MRLPCRGTGALCSSNSPGGGRSRGSHGWARTLRPHRSRSRGGSTSRSTTARSLASSPPRRRGGKEPRGVARPDRARIHLSGVFDGSRAMQLVNYLRREQAAEVVVDFSDVEGFESFGVDVLLRGLAPVERARATLRG